MSSTLKSSNMLKKLHIAILMLFTSFAIGQKKNVETVSVTLDELIPFVAKNFGNLKQKEQKKNIYFLIQFNSDLSESQKVILHQSFKLVSSSLSDNDFISILTYSGINGVAYKQNSPKEIRKIRRTLNDLKRSVKEIQPDGISFAYQYAETTFMEDANNSIVIIRNNKPNIVNQNLNSKNLKRQRNNAIILTAITLIPEVLSVLKKN